MKSSDLRNSEVKATANDQGVLFEPSSITPDSERGWHLALTYRAGEELGGKAARIADWVLIAWVVFAGVFFFRQFWDTALPYLGRLFRWNA